MGKGSNIQDALVDLRVRGGERAGGGVHPVAQVGTAVALGQFHRAVDPAVGGAQLPRELQQRGLQRVGGGQRAGIARALAQLEQFLDRGLAVPQADETLRLIQSAVLPKPGEDHQLFYFGRNLHDHIAASAANVGGGERLFLERSVHYDRLTPEAARRLEEASRKLAMHALESANKEAQNVCEHSGEGEWRWNFGLYVYLEPQGPAGPATPMKPE